MQNKWLRATLLCGWVTTVESKAKARVRNKTIPIFVPHWGCPQDCLFCDQKKITGQKEEMTPERAASIIQNGIAHKKEGDRLEIGFFGGSFTGIPRPQQEALLSVAQQAVVGGQIDGIRLSTRPDYINDTVLERLLHYGVTTVELGAQSTDDEVLALSRRGHTAEQTCEAAAKIRACGLHLGLQMMTGLPGDSTEKTIRTAEDFIAMQAECARIYPTLVIRGTALCELYESGEYEPLSLAEAVNRCSLVYRLFEKAGVDVIRMGLLQMNREDVAAGPVHPAFGELVQSRACLMQLLEDLRGFNGKELTLFVHPQYMSVLCGQKRSNIKKLSEILHTDIIRIIQSEAVPRGTVQYERSS